ncbi:MAG: hypothetical protein ABL971_07125 [Vicinamibacterales bacterium]
MKRLVLAALLALVAVLFSAGVVPMRAQQLARALQGGEWIDYGGDYSAIRYSPLSQITPANVSQLKVVWRWKSADREVQMSAPNLRASRYQDTPLMVNGLLYTVTPLGMVAALDPATGEQKWLFDGQAYKEPKPHSIGWTHRGLAWWSDGKGTDRVLVATTDAYIYSLDAKTGRPDPAFGTNGRIDATEGVRNAKRSVNFTARKPVVAGDVIVAGNALQDPPAGRESAFPPGIVRAWDVRTGKTLWTFNIIPLKGEFGYDTWLNNSADTMAAANAWGGVTYDPETDHVYFVTSNPGNDYNGVLRPGDNLFSDSIVCVEAKTGKRVWHYQVIHHDIWDYDLTMPPSLVDITVKGKRVKAVLGINKTAMVYLLDRRTGKPVFPTPEVAIPSQPQANGDQVSKTQPMPPQGLRMDHQGSSYEQLLDLTPELKKKALDNVQFLDLGPVYTAATARGLLASPTSLGGANWGGSAFDPETGILYTPTRTTTQILRQRPPVPGTPAAAAPPAAPVHGAGPTPPANLASLLYVDDLPLFRPPYARVTALDLNKGQKAWVTPIGNGPRNHPALKGLAKLPPLGDAILGGSPLVTKTMLFVGVTYTFVTGMPQPVPWEKWSDPGFQKNVLYAYDKKTGKQLAVFTADNLGAAGPMTYLYKGKQYLALATGNGPDSELVAYALP